jgi:DNA-binding NarL/FixJ family response regulator
VADPDLAAVTVVVVDEHPIWREGVARDLAGCGFSVLATVADSAFTAQVAAATRPRVVVVDLDPVERSAVEAVRTIANTMPDTRVLVLSERSEHRDVLEAVKAGAAGYLVKTASPDELVHAVRRTADGDAVFTPGLADLVLGEFQRMARQGSSPAPAAVAAPVAPVVEPAPVGAGVPRLTERETEVLRMVATGLTARQVATRLGLSHRTVENHVQSTLRKLHLHNRIELVRYAIAQGLAE